MRAACLAAALLLIPAGDLAVAADAPCRTVERPESRYTVCVADPRSTTTRLFWKDARDQPYGTLSALPDQNGPGQPLLFALNAGMYQPDQSPVGLYVENGRAGHRLSTANGPGNFHLKPNGVFFVAGGRAGVLATGAYAARKLRPELATQSGPMLVIDGRLHPRFTAAGTSRKRRDGVGVDGRGMGVFAISESAVTFTEFATLFRDALGCRNALFLDGSIVGLAIPSEGRRGGFWPLGPMLAVYAR